MPSNASHIQLHFYLNLPIIPRSWPIGREEETLLDILGGKCHGTSQGAGKKGGEISLRETKDDRMTGLGREEGGLQKRVENALSRSEKERTVWSFSQEPLFPSSGTAH